MDTRKGMVSRGDLRKGLALILGLALIGLWYFQRPSWGADPNAIKVQGADTTSANPLLIQANGQSATGSTQTPVTATASGANANTTATIPGVAGKFTYITGFQVTSNGATASTSVTVAVTGTVTGTMNYVYVTGTLNAAGDGQLIVTFPTPVPSSAVNTAIAVGVPALGAGNTVTQVSMQGFYQ